MRPSKPPSRKASAALAPARLAPTIAKVLWSLMSFLSSPYSRARQGQELLPCSRIAPHETVQGGGHGSRPGLLHPAKRHAHVLRLDHHADALRRQVLLEPVR